MSSSIYYALLADAAASRSLPPRRRAALQRALRAALPDLNRVYRRALAARFAITLGDELQCLLLAPTAIWTIAHDLPGRFPDVPWVVACGRGSITTPLARTAPEVDGPCFHAARAALAAAKRTGSVLVFGGFGGALAPFPDYYAGLYRSWTPRQRRVATLLRAGRPPAAVASLLGVDRSAISHVGRRMGWHHVAAGDRMFQAAILEAS